MRLSRRLARTSRKTQAVVQSLAINDIAARKPLTLDWESCGSHASCCSFVPYCRKMVFTKVLCTSHMTDTEGSTLASSSIAIIADVNEDSAPPYAALVSMPMSYSISRCARVQQTSTKRTTYPLFEKPFYNVRVHAFLLIHFTDLRPNNFVCKSLH